jgi:chromate transporter
MERPGRPEQENQPFPPSSSGVVENRLAEVALLFLRLGFTAFGGPAAHIAMMRDEVVQRRQWMNDERFVDLIGIANLIPGPSSTELAIYLGYLRAGWPGLFVAGVCFITPAMLIVLALAWAYVTYGSLPQVGWLFYGIQPVVVAIIAQAIWNLGRTVFKGALSMVVAILVLALYLLGVNVLILLFGGAATFGILRLLQYRWSHRQALWASRFLCCGTSFTVAGIWRYL